MHKTERESSERNRLLQPGLPEAREPLPKPSRVPAEILETEAGIVFRELDWQGRPVQEVVFASGCIGRADGK